MHRYLTEVIGTFFLVLTIGLTTVQGAEMAPLAVGSVLVVMVYMGGHVSGAHYNPAATLGVFLAGKLSAGDLPAYWVSQVARNPLRFSASNWLTSSGVPPYS